MKTYKSYQRYNQKVNSKHIGSNKRDSNNNIIYYESLSSYGSIIKHYQSFDNINRKIRYEDSTGNTNNITYWGNTNNIKQEYEIYINNGIKSLRIINYNRFGCINNKSIISGNYRYYQDYNNPNNNYEYYSPYYKII